MTNKDIEAIIEEFKKMYWTPTRSPLQTQIDWLRTTLTTLRADHARELEEVRREERERIEEVFKQHVPTHALDLEDSVWLKRLLNKAFGHENIH